MKDEDTGEDGFEIAGCLSGQEGWTSLAISQRLTLLRGSAASSSRAVRKSGER